MPWGDSSFGDSNGYGDGSGLFTYVNSNKDFYRISNFDYTNLSSAINQKTMLIDVDDISVFPPPPFAAVIDKEIIKVINSTGNTLIAQRAMENTLPAAHVSGSFISSIFTENVIHSVCDKFRNYDDIIYDTGTSTLKIQNADDLSLYYNKWETVTETGVVGLNLNYPTVTDNQINDFYVSLTGTYYSNAVATSYARNASGLSSVTQSIKDGIKVYDNNKYIGSYQNRNQLATSKLLKVLGTKSLATVDLKDFEYISVAEDATDSVQDELTIKAMSASYDGHEIVLFNDSETKSMRILHNGYGSLTGATIDENILTPYPYNCLTIDPKGAIRLIYDGTKQSWRTLTNMYYYEKQSFQTVKVKNYQKVNSSVWPQYLNLYDMYGFWELYLNQDAVNYYLFDYLSYLFCETPVFLSFENKDKFYLSKNNFDIDGGISSEEWCDVYDPNYNCKKYKETEIGQYPNENMFVKVISKNETITNSYNNNFEEMCSNFYFILWWVQNDKTVKVKRIKSPDPNPPHDWRLNTFCDIDCSFNGGGGIYNPGGPNNPGGGPGGTTPAPGTTTTTTTTTTTAGPQYWFCFGGVECYPPQCVGPFNQSPYSGATWCNVTGGFASLAACQASGCEATTTTTTAAPTTTTTAAPTTTTTAAPTTTTTTTTTAPCTGSCLYGAENFPVYGFKWVLIQSSCANIYPTCYCPAYSYGYEPTNKDDQKTTGCFTQPQ